MLPQTAGYPPKYRLVRHRKIRVKPKSENQWWRHSLRLTSCLVTYDSYYFSPSKVSCVSSLPDFKFKTPFDYRLVRQQAVDAINRRRIVKDKTIDKKMLSKEKTRTSAKSHRKIQTVKQSLDSSSSTIVYYNTNNDDNNTSFSDNDIDVPINGNNVTQSKDTIDKNQMKRSSLLLSKTPELLDVSSVERILDKIIDKKLKKFEERLNEITLRSMKTSTPLKPDLRRQSLDINLSQISGKLLMNETVRSVGIQVNQTKTCHQMTQTLTFVDQSVQTDIPHQTNGTYISVSDKTKKTSDSLKSVISDSDPECPFPSTFMAIIRQMH